MQGETTSIGKPPAGRAIPVTLDEAKAALARVLQSREFQRATRNRNFLRYVVDETLAGRADRIKAYSVAVSALGRGEGFDAQTDPIVRIEAGKLRRRIERYYLTDGIEDPVRIEMPKGGYVPVFRRRPEAGPPAGMPVLSSWLRSMAPATALAAVAALTTAFTLSLASSFLPVPHAGAPRLAVIPFVAVGGDGRPEDALLAEGLDDEVKRILTHYDGVAVASVRGSGRPSDPNLVLSGSVRAVGGMVRVTAQLADPRTSLLLWSRTHDRAAGKDGVFDVQVALAAEIASRLASPYGVLARLARGGIGEENGRQTAYECFLLTFRHREIPSRENYASARRCADRLVRSEPGNAAPWALSALLLLDAGRFEEPRPDPAAMLAAAARAAIRATELEPDSVLALQGVAAVQFASGRAEEAVATLERALRLTPRNPELLAQLGTYLAFGGRWDEGGRLVEEALDIGGDGPGWYHFVLACRDYGRQAYGTARDHASRASDAGLPAARLLLAAARAKLGEASPEGDGHADREAGLRDLRDLRLPARFVDALMADFDAGPAAKG